jgi:hypothetical protein
VSSSHAVGRGLLLCGALALRAWALVPLGRSCESARQHVGVGWTLPALAFAQTRADRELSDSP